MAPAVQPGKWGPGDFRETDTRGKLGLHPRPLGQGGAHPSHDAAAPQSQGSSECCVKKHDFLLEINGAWIMDKFPSIAT